MMQKVEERLLPDEKNNLEHTILKDDFCHLMVQTMEAWFLADLNNLKNFMDKDLKKVLFLKQRI